MQRVWQRSSCVAGCWNFPKPTRCSGIVGARLGISYPEIYEMQARAIFESRDRGFKGWWRSGHSGNHDPADYRQERARNTQGAAIIKVAGEVETEKSAKLEFLVGTMIELPRAALKAGEIAEEAEFFSFGTNDLTPDDLWSLRVMTRPRFLDTYISKDIFAGDPFVSLDQEGVGELVSIAAERGRKTRSDIKLGILRRTWR